MRRFYVAAALLSTLLLASLTVLAQTPSREDLLNEITAKRAELDALERTFLAPSEADRTLYAAFLREPDTGLIRLLPRETYDDIANKDRKRIVTRGGGAYYSFTRLTHEYGYGSDIELSQGTLSSGGFGGASYGFLTNLGDVSLEGVNAETPALVPFAAYKAVREEPLARIEQRRFGQGAELAGLPVKKHLPMKLNSTYLLRSINYPESDVLVAFRVVRIDSDGSAIILWKLLKKYESPQLNRPEPVVVG